jgi:hypothetical protein
MTATTERALRDQIVLSPAAKRAQAFLDVRGTSGVAPLGNSAIAQAWAAGAEKPTELLSADLVALIRDQERKWEFWAETEKQKRIIAALVELIDGPRVEQAPSVAASRHAIQAQIDTQARLDEALKQARWIASEFPADCSEDGCTVVDGKCLDCGESGSAAK